MKERTPHPSQRGWFAEELYKLMEKDNDVWCLTGDLGFAMLDAIRDSFPDRFLNTGASEQALMDIAVGLALRGKKPYVYSITTFLLRRPFETIKLYIDHENIPIVLVGSGRDTDYKHDGPSHDATGIKDFLDILPNIVQYWPETKEEIPAMVEEIARSGRPAFISLRR